MGPGAARREGGGKDNAFTSRAAEVVATPGEVMKHALCVRPAAGHPGASKAAEGRHCARLESSPSASLSWPWPAKWWSTGSGAPGLRGQSGIGCVIRWLAMHTGIRPLLSFLLLVLWLVSGPVAMAFDGCAMMGAMCEAPCGVLSYIVAPTVSNVAALQPLAYLESRTTQQPARISAPPLTPPPKSAPLPA